MGRRLSPIKDTGPVGEFATRLRARQAQLVPRPTYRDLAKLCHYSHSVLADAAKGEKLPTWEVAEAFVRACGADEEETSSWRTYWLETRQALEDLLRKLGQASLVAQTRTLTGQAARPARLRPVLADIAEPAQCQPHPDQVRTYEDLHYQLHVLKIAVGNPSLRVLHRHMGREYGLSTLSDIFAGHRMPGATIFTAIVTGLLTIQGPSASRPAADEPWRSVQNWEKAWSQAEYNRVRPDLMRRRRYGNLVLTTPEQDEGPTASVIAAMDTAVAAALLASLPPTVAGRILSDMPPKEAQQVIKMMVELTSTTTPSPPAIPAPGPVTDPDDANAGGQDTDGDNPAGKAV
jgi:Helix-turn-helix domain